MFVSVYVPTTQKMLKESTIGERMAVSFFRFRLWTALLRREFEKCPAFARY
jgi:hypothetical protein